MDTPRESRLFYGWIIVFAGLWVTLVAFGVVNSFSVFFKPLAQEFGWDRGMTSLACAADPPHPAQARGCAPARLW